MAEAEALAGLADAAQHRGEGDEHPEGLLPILGPLERPGGGERGGEPGTIAREGGDDFGRDAGDRRGPGGGFRDPVRLARHIGLEPLEAHRAAGEEIAIGEALGEQHMRHREHQRGVGAGTDGQPFSGPVAAHRRDADEPHAGGDGMVGRPAHQMLGPAARMHLVVAVAHAAETDHEPGMARDLAPFDHRAPDARAVAHNVRHQRHAGGIGVVGELAGVAAGGREHAMELLARMMEAPGGGPAVAAAEDAGGAVRVAHAGDLAGDEGDRPVPGEGNEFLGPARRAAGAVAGEPALAHIRPVDARGGMHGRGNARDERRRRRIGREGPHRRKPSLLDHRRERAPMRGVRLQLRHAGKMRRSAATDKADGIGVPAPWAAE